MKKVVIIHDWLTGFRGGERVLEAIAEIYPEAQIYTLFHKKGSTSEYLENRVIKTSFLNKIPGIHLSYRNFLPLFPLAIRSLKIPNDTDIVISSSHCVSKGIEVPARCKHISYIHSPMRYIYDQFDSYFGKEKIIKRAVGYLIRPYLRTFDFITNSSVDKFIANSQFVSKRISLFYNKKSEVIYPFVDLEDFRQHQKRNIPRKNYFLMVTALAPNKRVDLAVKAFAHLGWDLLIIGTGQDGDYLQRSVPLNVKFLGNLSRSEVIHMMFEAKGFVFPGVEDFGITPLESLAAGTPVIAFAEGGALETLNEDVAVFFDSPNENSLIDTLLKYDVNKFSREVLFKRAEIFSKEKFKIELSQAVSAL